MNILNYIISKIVYGGGIIFDLAKWFILALIVIAIVNTFFFSVFVVDGASMEPNLHDKELVFWNKNAYSNHDPKRGDVVVINYPGDPIHKKYVKRIIGLPGETVQVANGGVSINGVVINESYIAISVETTQDGIWKIPAGQYFVMGDNRPNSNDSRYFGPVERRFVLGQALAIVFPRFLIIEHN